MVHKSLQSFQQLTYMILPCEKIQIFFLSLKNSQYEEGYHISHPTIQMFWKAFHKFTLDEKKKFLCKYAVHSLSYMKVNSCE